MLPGEEDFTMTLLFWAVVALVVSLIAAGLGFTGVAAGAAVVARALFGIFLLIAIVLFILVLLGVGAVDAVTQLDALRSAAG
jgi:uncharacterized membrane protein YtjA (UPF0391 family)